MSNESIIEITKDDLYRIIGQLYTHNVVMSELIRKMERDKSSSTARPEPERDEDA